MPVMKQTLARPAIKEAVVLDLGDIGAQAEKLRRAAEAKAQQIIDTAQARAEALAEGAAERGHAQGLERGIAEGREQGIAAGHAEALNQTAKQVQSMLSAWSAVATQIDGQRTQLEREARQAVLEFALRLAEKLVHRVVQVDRSVVVDQVAHALSHVLGPLEVTVYLNPEDVPLVEEAMPQLLKEFSELKHIHLDTDAGVARGGCRAAFADGQVDATIEKQLERIVALMLPDADDDQTLAGRSRAALVESPAPPVSPASPAPPAAEAGPPDAATDTGATPGDAPSSGDDAIADDAGEAGPPADAR